MSETNETIEITFSDAYAELKSITDRLNGEQVEADELVDLLRRGKSLEAALRQDLTEIEQEVEAIESGEGIGAYKIVRAAAGDDGDDVPADTSDFEGATARSGSDDDIPF